MYLLPVLKECKPDKITRFENDQALQRYKILPYVQPIPSPNKTHFINKVA
jgi:hypothetical protein